MHKQCELMSAAEVAQLLNVTPGYVAHKLLRTHVLRPVFPRPRLDFGPIPVEATDDIVVVAIKVPETA